MSPVDRKLIMEIVGGLWVPHSRGLNIEEMKRGEMQVPE